MAAVRRLCGLRVSLALFVFTWTQNLFSDGASYSRQLFVQVNPGGPPSPPGGDLLHVRAVGNNDTLHFLFCSQGAPTLLLVHTDSPNSTVQISWPEFLARNSSGSLRVAPESSVLSSSAVLFSRLLEYDDVNDTATPPPAAAALDLQDFIWSRLNLSDATARLCGANPASGAGALCLQLSVFGSGGHGDLWPHLLHTANSSELRLWLDGVPPRAPRSRFLLELQTVGTATSRVDERRSIDDEFTPSIFKVSQWVSLSNGSSDVLSFVQWKPVAYRRPRPSLEDATPCRHSSPRRQDGAASRSGLVRAFFSGDEDVVGLNVSFGLAGEPFYNSTRFLSWTVLVGIGSPPVDSFSPLVLAIMAVGLGTPMMLLVVGGACVCLRRRREEHGAYEPIN